MKIKMKFYSVILVKLNTFDMSMQPFFVIDDVPTLSQYFIGFACDWKISISEMSDQEMHTHRCELVNGDRPIKIKLENFDFKLFEKDAPYAFTCDFIMQADGSRVGFFKQLTKKILFEERTDIIDTEKYLTPFVPFIKWVSSFFSTWK